MKKNKKLIIILVAVILIIFLFPIRLQYKDGGTSVYRSIVGIYEVTDWNQMGASVENFETRKTGITVNLFGLTVFDNSKTRIVEPWNGSTIDIFAAISPENFPVDLTADEMLAQAIEEEFVVTESFQFLSGEQKWQEFFETTKEGNPAIIYLAHYYTLNKDRVSEELYEQEKDEYPKIFLFSLYFDGEQYTVTERPGYEEEPEMVRSYPYLVKFEGEPSSPSALFDRYEYYVLVHETDVTWEELEWTMFSSQLQTNTERNLEHNRIVSKHITE